MIFPFDYCGRLTWSAPTELNPEEFQQRFVRRLAAALTEVKGRVTVNKNKVSFTGGVFRAVEKSNILNPIGKGHVTIEVADEGFVVSYCLSFKQWLVISFAIANIFYWVPAMSDDPPSMNVALAIFILVWIFWFGTQFLTSIIRFPEFVRQVLRSI